jgi:hypothetical protein
MVQFQIMSCIEVSKDGKILYYKTGVFDDATGVDDNGQIYKIADDQVSLIAENINGKRLAISNDEKLYISPVMDYLLEKQTIKKFQYTLYTLVHNF